MTSIRSAVAQTLAYSRHFGLPLTAEKLHLWLIFPKPVRMELLKNYFPVLTSAQKKLITNRLLTSKKKHAYSLHIARLLSFFPTIKMICSTGSLAINNAKTDDDLDFFIVTSADTLWLTRPFVIFFLKLLGLRRPTSLPEHRSPKVANKVCDNLWLDETALSLPKNKQNLYTAHEVLQARPLFDRGGVYLKFILANSWTKKFLANAYVATQNSAVGVNSESAAIPIPRQRESVVRARKNFTPRAIKWLNRTAFKLQYYYMKRKITRETITLHAAYFHPNDYGTIKLDG